MANRPSPTADAGYASSRVSPASSARRPAGRVHVAGAQVHHVEIRHRAAGVPQRPDHQHGLGRSGQATPKPRATAPSTRPGRRPGAAPSTSANPASAARHPGPACDVERVARRRPPGLRHAEQDARPVAQREHRAGGAPAPRRGGGHAASSAGGPVGPPQVVPGGDHPLLRAVELRRQPPPAARLGAAEPVLRRAARARRRRRAATPRPRPRRTGSAAARRARRRARRRPCARSAPRCDTSSRPSAPGSSHSPGQPGRRVAVAALPAALAAEARSGGAGDLLRLSTAAAISVLRHAPRRRPCPRAAGPPRPADQPCRSISTPLAIATTAATSRLGAAPARARAADARRPRRAAARRHRCCRPTTPPPPRPGRRDAETVPSFASDAKRSADLHPRRELDSRGRAAAPVRNTFENRQRHRGVYPPF